VHILPLIIIIIAIIKHFGLWRKTASLFLFCTSVFFFSFIIWCSVDLSFMLIICFYLYFIWSLQFLKTILTSW
jgi:hypothetical protein